MNPETDFHEATELMLRYLEGLTTPDEAKRLSALMRQSRPVRRHCTILLQQHLQLFEIAEETATRLVETGPVPADKILSLPGSEARAWWGDWRLWAGGSAAAAAVVIFLSVSGGSKPGTPAGLAGVELEIKSADKLVLAQNDGAWLPGQKVSAKRVTVASGAVNFRVSSGVNIAASGPVEFEFLDAMYVRLVRGQLTAEVEPQARGFTVLTPHGKVVDLGTRFGVDVAQSAGADVVVFQGEVQVYKMDEAAGTSPLSLVAGEAVRLAGNGEASRIGSVITGPGTNEWTARGDAGAVVAAVTDNNTNRYSNRFYPILRHGMAEGVFAWPYKENKPRWWSQAAANLPAWLAGADVVQTLNEEVGNAALQISVELARPCMLYVFYQDGAPVPEWLARDFSDTGERLTLSPDSPALPGDPGSRGSYQASFRIWQQTVSEPGRHALGAVLKADVNSPPFYMYGLAAKAL